MRQPATARLDPATQLEGQRKTIWSAAARRRFSGAKLASRAVNQPQREPPSPARILLCIGSNRRNPPNPLRPPSDGAGCPPPQPSRICARAGHSNLCGNTRIFVGRCFSHGETHRNQPAVRVLGKTGRADLQPRRKPLLFLGALAPEARILSFSANCSAAEIPVVPSLHICGTPTA